MCLYIPLHLGHLSILNINKKSFHPRFFCFIYFAYISNIIKNVIDMKKELIWKLESTVYLLDEIVLNYRSEDWNSLKARIADRIGVTKGSVNMAIGNLKWILSDGAEGLSAYTVRQEEAVKLTLEKYEMGKQKLLMILS